MSDTIQLDFQLYVKCPSCGESFDMKDENCTDQDEVQEGVINPVFNNKWDDARCNVTCPECEEYFTVKGVEY